MAQTIIIDPVTRIEGHLKIEAVVDDGVVKEARSAGTLWRGFEKILQGRDPPTHSVSHSGSAVSAPQLTRRPQHSPSTTPSGLPTRSRTTAVSAAT